MPGGTSAVSEPSGELRFKKRPAHREANAGLTKMLVTALLLVTGRRDFGRFEFARYLLGFSNAQVRFCSGE